MSWLNIKRLNEERAAHLASMKALLSAAETEKRDLKPEESAQFDELNGKAEKALTELKRYEQLADFEKRSKEELEQRRQQPGRDDVSTPEKRAEAEKLEKRKAVDAYLRYGMRAEEARSLTAANSNDPEIRALSLQGVGGVVGDRPFYDQLVLGMKAYAGVRQAGATIITSSNGNTITVPFLNDTNNTGQIVGEGTTDNSAADAATGFITLGAYKFDSKWIKLSVELIQDAAFPIEATVLQMASERIGRYFNTVSTTGSGSNQPKGFVSAASTGKVAAATNAVVYDEIIDHIHSVDVAYRNSGKATVMLHDTTLAAIRKLKNGQGQYLWNAGEAGAPNQILGYPYIVNNDMAQLTSGVNSAVMAFGDFSRYFVRDITAPLIVRADQLFIGDGFVGYRVFQRSDGNLADLNAVKLLKTAAS